jgi:hypothetical protein
MGWIEARRLGRGVGRFALVLGALALGFPVLYALLVPEEAPAPVTLPTAAESRYRVWVVDWGYHAAIAVEQPAGWRLGPLGEEAAPIVEYAWGDRRFYHAADHRPPAVAATLFAPTDTVLYLDGHASPAAFRRSEAVYVRAVDGETVRRLLVELEGSFRRLDTERRSPLAPARGFGGRFYPARGAYLWTRDCNWWVVAHLAGVELASAPTGVVLTPQVPGRLNGFEPVALPDRSPD